MLLRILHSMVSRGTLRPHVLLVLRHDLWIPVVLRRWKVKVATKRLLRVDFRAPVLRIRLIAAAVASKEDLHNHQATEDQEHSMYELSFIARHLEARASSPEAPVAA